MKCIIILALLLGISNAFSSNFVLRGLQREVRINGERRIFIRNASMMIIFNVPKNHPDYLEVVEILDGRLIRKVVMDDKQSIIVDVSDNGLIEKYSQEEMNEAQITTISPPTENHQFKVLLNILRNHEGFSGEGAFYEILKQVKQFVDKKELKPIIYEILKDLEVQPKQVPAVQKKNETVEKSDDVSEKVAKKIGEAAKYDNLNETIKIERDAKFKTLEAMRAAQQIEWLQKLLAMKRYQHVSDVQNLTAQQEDPVKQIDSFINSTAKYGEKNDTDLRQMLIETNIQEIQKEINRHQLIAQQLQNQQNFLAEQKHQMKMLRIIGYHQGVQSDQIKEMNDVYKQIKGQERKLVGEQIRVLKRIHDLQAKLILQYQELDENLSKED